MALKLLGNSFTDGAYLADRHNLRETYGFGRAGGNVLPEILWEGLPGGTKSMVSTCYDPDAPTGSGLWSPWIRWALPARGRPLTPLYIHSFLPVNRHIPL